MIPDTVIINKGNYFDQTNMTLQLCAAVLRRKEMLLSLIHI